MPNYIYHIYVKLTTKFANLSTTFMICSSIYLSATPAQSIKSTEILFVMKTPLNCATKANMMISIWLWNLQSLRA